MEHFLNLEGKDLSRLQSNIFPQISAGETILFLGAGASVTDEKKYLSSEIMEYYSDKKGIKLTTNDITDFVDTLSANKTFDRDEFDEFVGEILKKLRISETHRTIASIGWKEIITTNYDLLIEKAFDDLENSSRAALQCWPVRNLAQYQYRPANDEIKYVKLNGCLSDKRKYPFVFSTKDFENSKRYYARVLSSLSNLSSKISFLSAGYSYSDVFAKKLLERFDKANFRNTRWLFNLDPFVEKDRLDFFATNRICVIKATTADFFSLYKEWEEKNLSSYLDRNPVVFKTNANRLIPVSARVRQRVSGNLIQLLEGNAFAKISPLDFYGGKEPNFSVITENLDVVKDDTVNLAAAKLKEISAAEARIIPTLVLEGSYGTGKSTLSYRVISNLLNDPQGQVVAFEILNPYMLQPVDLEEIFIGSKAKTIVLFFNGIELDTSFKGLITLRNRLSVEQFAGFDICFLASMRENILAQYLKEHEYRNFHKLNVDRVFTEEEADDLVTKLQGVGLVKFRDAKQKYELVQKVISEYEGDTLVSLISMVSSGTHYQIIRNAYNDLNAEAQKVFLYTSLLYRFGILMPASLLRRLIDISWDDFAREIIPYNFKNYIFKVERNTPGTDPDLYFKTRHPVISDKLVEILLPDEDQRFEKYEYLLRRLVDSTSSSELAVNLLKTLRHNDDLSSDKIDRLFDICGQEFHEDAHFNLHYAINLQFRGDETSLRKGLQRIGFAEAFYEKRNHRLIHRKAKLSFQLAKLYFEKEGTQLNETYKYIDEARGFFEIKLLLDPFSSYSYADYIRFEIWFMESFNLDERGIVRQRIKIDELIDQAEKAVFDDLSSISTLKADYLRTYKNRSDAKVHEYENYLEQLCQNPTQRPYGLILSFYQFQDDPERIKNIVQQLEEFQYLDDAAKILFRFYGRNLHILENRLKFMTVVKKHKFLEKKDAARFYFYSYINEIYNGHFDSAYEYLHSLRSTVSFLNPELSEVWRDSETGKERIFEGFIYTKQGKWKKVKIPELQKSFDLRSGSRVELLEDELYRVKLRFHLSGVKAEIVQ
jgi:hypothetical protein